MSEPCEIHNYPEQPLIIYKTNKKQLLPYVKAIDKGKVIRKGYRALIAISHDFSREYLVSQTWSNINSTMNQQIHISLIDINQYLNSEINIDNIENENVVYGITELVRKAGYHNIKDILKYIIPTLIKNQILNPLEPTIYIRISENS
ncbi:4388_t:CDS:2 [Gigaspora margarita]|uniref:4388_t:CDS:1 n=1 Tax=Gigaspora margarita TaxID=4874 RepID=A0ABN7VY84_GIGMA|nr:4388_t:CDS:2 [Gigaspora margarita]